MKIHYYNISWNSRVDGPGHRVVLFLQGCHLRCPWCHSPHSLDRNPPLLFFESRCVRCGKCETACRNKVHEIKDGKHIIHRSLCRGCGHCVRVCPTTVSPAGLAGALALPAVSSKPARLFQRLLPQLDLLRRIGGLTVSGGEPLLQYRPLLELLTMCKEEGIHTAVETSGSLPQSRFDALIHVVDCWLFGLRPVPADSCPPDQVANMKTVKENLRFLHSRNPQNIIIRTPVIPGFTDSPAQLSLIAGILQADTSAALELLPYNPHSGHFYKAMGRDIPPPLAGIKRREETGLSRIRDFFTAQGLTVRIVTGQ